jgi:hypothetical protein
LKPLAVDNEDVTPPEKVAVNRSGILKITMPEPPFFPLAVALAQPPPPPAPLFAVPSVELLLSTGASPFPPIELVLVFVVPPEPPAA